MYYLNSCFVILFYFLPLCFCTNNIDISLVPLTNLRNIQACFNSSSLLIKCEIGSRIRILESFLGSSNIKNKNKCMYKENDCRSSTNIQNICNGNITCQIELHKTFLTECDSNADYISVSYECIPDTKIHNICSFTENIDTWGTLEMFSSKTYDDCWCTLSTQYSQRILLSVITFSFQPYDLACPQIGFYLRSDYKKDKECTILRKNRYYISSNNNLYLNFNPKNTNLNTKYWIIYEGSDNESKVRLKCGMTKETTNSLTTQTTARLTVISSSNPSTTTTTTTTTTVTSLAVSVENTTILYENSTNNMQTYTSKTILTSLVLNNSAHLPAIKLKTIFYAQTTLPSQTSWNFSMNVTENLNQTLDSINSRKNESNATTPTPGILQAINTKAFEISKKIGKTELIIIVGCVLLILVLTLFNLLIYVFRKLVTRKTDIQNLNNDNNINGGGKKSLYNVLPGVGEIILWADEDRRGYLIDRNGSWAKIDTQRWVKENMSALQDTYKRASMAYRKRFWKKADKSMMTKGERYIIRNNDFEDEFVLPTVPEVSENGSNSDTGSKKSIKQNVNCEIQLKPEKLSSFKTDFDSAKKAKDIDFSGASCQTILSQEMNDINQPSNIENKVQTAYTALMNNSNFEMFATINKKINDTPEKSSCVFNKTVLEEFRKALKDDPKSLNEKQLLDSSIGTGNTVEPSLKHSDIERATSLNNTNVNKKKAMNRSLSISQQCDYSRPVILNSCGLLMCPNTPKPPKTNDEIKDIKRDYAFSDKMDQKYQESQIKKEIVPINTSSKSPLKQQQQNKKSYFLNDPSMNMIEELQYKNTNIKTGKYTEENNNEITKNILHFQPDSSVKQAEFLSLQKTSTELSKEKNKKYEKLISEMKYCAYTKSILDDRIKTLAQQEVQKSDVTNRKSNDIKILSTELFAYDSTYQCLDASGISVRPINNRIDNLYNFSMRTCISDGTSSIVSRRSMLSEAKAKLEILNSNKPSKIDNDSNDIYNVIIDKYDLTETTQF